MNYSYDFPRPSVAVDVVLVSLESAPRLLLIRRKRDPFAGKWALPGGFIDENEPPEAAARRELREETGADGLTLELLGVFGDKGRDPRGWTISIVYIARVDPMAITARAGDDAAEVGWHSLADLPPLAFDHAKIIAGARQRIHATTVT